MELTNVLIVSAAVLVLGLISLMFMRRSRSHKLSDRFGTEYERTVDQLGSREKADKELNAREKRVERYTIRPLSEVERSRFSESWTTTQGHFVDSPVAAVSQADQLVTEVMRVRGYPMADFDQRAADLSVDHPKLMENYHAAHDLALKSHRGDASTEDLQQAMVHCRVLFEELVETPQGELVGAR